MRKSHIAVAALLLLTAGGAAWYFLSPGWTLRAMVEAAKAGDEERFSSYVDYPALREDLRAEMTDRLQAAAKNDGDPAAQIGAAMGLAIMGPLVDSMVSPKGMKLAFAKLAREELAREKTGRGGGGEQPKINRIGFSTFRVSGDEMPGSGFVFERRGLGWKLTGVDLSKGGEAR